jgi:urease beta subunit
MVGESSGRLARVSDTRTLRLTIPADLASDTSFPFEPGEEVKIEIVENGLNIRELEQDD